MRRRSAHPSASTHSNPLLGTIAPRAQALALIPNGTGAVAVVPVDAPIREVPVVVPVVVPTVAVVVVVAEAASGGGEHVFCRESTVVAHGV